ncbi:hypothetical protein GAGA_4048 [Paraglaciecola agarilytica NO2]|uniref:Uncharacterized protein n=1 Tax=Paraglaciecola agarilytica NO2 TaxID=1125747 RepID=A0ABQ0IC74_9ALTE|nr:hypothetical protein GAGA_4048 [Paraglaciecola agarilytica NO2]
MAVCPTDFISWHACAVNINCFQKVIDKRQLKAGIRYVSNEFSGYK